METPLVIFGLLFAVTFTVLYFWSVLWGFKDANSRGKNGFAVATLIALFAWPFGLLFWTVIRPEGKKALEVNRGAVKPNKYVSDFKEMPFLMKLLLLVSLYVLVTTILDFIQMKPVAFGYFNSSFPRNYPLIWYLYNILFGIFSIIVYFKRSYSVLTKYLCVSAGILAVGLLNSAYFVVNLPVEKRIVTVVVYAVGYVFAGLIFAYLLQQKKYFNKT